jgi:anaerobic magnesium-protoporphyrin IX monomethyl ester cyclase
MSHNLDYLFVRPNSKSVNYGQLDDFKLTAIEPPLWPAMLAAYCREKGFRVDILDAEVEGFNTTQTAFCIVDLEPKVVIINVCGHNPSASTQSMGNVFELIQILKTSPEPPRIILHGLHPSALPEASVKETGADGVIIGEGFDVFELLLDWKGLYFKSLRLQDLTTLPQPAWDLLPIYKYRTHNWHCFGQIQNRQGYGLVYTSLGCPYNCSFCVIHVMTNDQRRIRFRSVKQVMDDIDFWVKMGVKNIRFVDENFTSNAHHATSVCKAITAKYGDGLNIWAYASPTSIESELLTVLRAAGIKWLGVGFESADLEETKVKDLPRGINWEEESEYTAQLIRMADININANWIFGLQNDNYHSMQRTLHLAQRINSEWANIYCAMAFPGSELYKQAIMGGLSLPKTYSGYSQYTPDCLPLPTTYLTSKEVVGFRDYAFKTYYSNPLYQNRVTKRFGVKTTQHIQDFLKIEIKRD